MDEWGDDAFGDDLFTSTPAPTDAVTGAPGITETPGPTSLPLELRPVDPKTLVKSTTLGKGQWDTTFASDGILTQKSSADLLKEQEEQEIQQPGQINEDPTIGYDGPTPTGKGISDLAESLGLPPTFTDLFADMQEAVLGIAGDLMGSSTERQSLAEILTHNNRLRGIGAMLVLIASLGLLLDAFAESEKTSTLVSQLMDSLKK